MKIESLKLVYFSPTGTTKKIIERITQGVSHGTVEIADITKPEGKRQQLQTSEKELLIIGVPVYFGRVQTNAIEWLHTIKAHNSIDIDDPPHPCPPSGGEGIITGSSPLKGEGWERVKCQYYFETVNK